METAGKGLLAGGGGWNLAEREPSLVPGAPVETLGSIPVSLSGRLSPL